MEVNFNNINTPNYNAISSQKMAQKSFGRKIISEKSADNVSRLGVNFNSAMQRGLMGVLALVTQPFIDARNKNVDEETRKASVARTTAKIIAGTTTGVIIREAMIKLTKIFSQNDNIKEYEHNFRKKNDGIKYVPQKKFKAWQQLLLPGDKKFKNNIDASSIKKMRNSVGTIAAIIVMLYTNFAIDAPLTTYLTNKFYNPDKTKGAK